MSEALRRPSHAPSWLLGIVGAQVLYVLGAGPVEYWEVKNALGSPSGPPAWMVRFFHPAIRICQDPPLGGMMEPYLAWWVRMGAEKS